MLTRFPFAVESLEDRKMMSVGPATIDNGAANDTVYDANTSTLHVVYYDVSSKSLKYQSFNENGTKSAITTIDGSGDNGVYLSLAEDSAGVLHVAYYDNVNANLKYARRDTNGTWSTQVIDSRNTVGLYPSIAIDANDRPAITYFYKSAGDLKLATFNGTSWSTSGIVTSGTVGRYSSLRLNPVTDKLSVAFEDSGNGTYLYADQGSKTLWSTVVIDSNTKGGGGYVSLNFNKAQRPSVSYYDAFNADLKYAERSSRGKWNNVTVASKGSVGTYSDLAYTFDTDEPAIVYYNKSHDSGILAFRSPNGVWNYDEEFTGGGRNLSASDGPVVNNTPPALYLVWSDTASGKLKVQKF